MTLEQMLIQLKRGVRLWASQRNVTESTVAAYLGNLSGFAAYLHGLGIDDVNQAGEREIAGYRLLLAAQTNRGTRDVRLRAARVALLLPDRLMAGSGPGHFHLDVLGNPAVAAYQNVLDGSGNTLGTRTQEASRIEGFIRWLCAARMCDPAALDLPTVTPEDIERYLFQARPCLQPATKRSIRGALHRFFAFQTREGVVAANPVVPVPVPGAAISPRARRPSGQDPSCRCWDDVQGTGEA